MEALGLEVCGHRPRMGRAEPVRSGRHRLSRCVATGRGRPSRKRGGLQLRRARDPGIKVPSSLPSTRRSSSQIRRKCRPVETVLTEKFWAYWRPRSPRTYLIKHSKRTAFRDLLRDLEGCGFVHRVRLLQNSKNSAVFLEVFPSPTMVLLFPALNRHGHFHGRALRYKHKPGRSSPSFIANGRNTEPVCGLWSAGSQP